VEVPATDGLGERGIMPKFEYRIFMLTEISHMQKKLNEYAQDGFVLDQFQVVHLQGLRSEFYVVAKRELPETA
jgi:hypothetical protein